MKMHSFILFMILIFAAEAFAQNGENTNSLASGLLSVKEGNFKYSRIPEIRLSAQPKEKAGDLVRITPAENKEEESEDSGFFGIGIKAANIVIKVLVVLLVIGLFVLYKVRSGKKRHKVFFKR